MVELIGYIVIMLFVVYGLPLLFMLISLLNNFKDDQMENFAYGAFITLFCIAIFIGSFLAKPETYGYQKIIESEEVSEQ